MTDYAVPAVCALFVWWFSTGVVLLIVRRPNWTFPISIFGAGLLFAAALYGLAKSSADPTVWGAYIAFSCAILLWGSQEIAFLTGFLTGPRTDPSPEASIRWQRAGYAILAILYHEVALIVSGAAVLAVSWSEPNQVGTWTFLLLWAMRLSAKLNLFLGVPVLNDEFLPEHLQYLKSFFTKKAMNILFPLSVTVSTGIAVLLFAKAVSPEASTFEIAGFTLLATLMTLAVLEHWFMILPLPIAALWSWGMRTRISASEDAVVSPSASSKARLRVVPKQ